MIKRQWFKRRKSEVDCREVGRLLQSYLDEDIDADLAEKLRTHLDACKDCGLELDTYRRIKDALASQMPEVSAEAIERLREFGRELSSDSPAS